MSVKMIEHTIELHGPSCHGKFARPEAIGAVLARVKPTVLETVRMGFLRSSRRIGRPLRELRAMSEVYFGGQSRGPDNSTRLHFKAPILRDAAPKLFKQPLLWDDSLRPDDTALDLVGDLLGDIGEKKRESDRYDSDLLKRVANFDVALKHGLSEIQIHGHRNDRARCAPVINHQIIVAAKALFDETPPPKRARIAGRFDMIRMSDRAFQLVLIDGKRVNAVWIEPEIVALRDFLNLDVVIEGVAVYRPSGALLRIDASAITIARDSDMLFSITPQPESGRADTNALLKPQTKTTGINAIWGTWPGNESEEELLDAIKEVR